MIPHLLYIPCRLLNNFIVLEAGAFGYKMGTLKNNKSVKIEAR